MVPTPRPFLDALGNWQPGYFLDQYYPGRRRLLVDGIPALRKVGFGRGAAAPAVGDEAEVALPESLPPSGAPAAERPLEEWERESAKQLEQDLAVTPPKSPTKVGTVTNWEGYSCEIWYYPDVSSYGVVCPFDHTRDSGPIYRDSLQAKLYAEGTLGIGTR